MLDILYRDDALVAVHKPSGLLVHRTALDRHAERFALQMVRDQIGQRVYPVHRLDKGTSGILLFALERDTATRLARAFEQREVLKRYIAVVRGHPPQRGTIDHPLTRDELVPDETAREDAERTLQQAAVTHYRCLATTELPVCVDRYPTSRYALVELLPETGRQHQIRRHLKHIAHPVIGDATHGVGRHNRLFGRLFGSHRLLLANIETHFPHPFDGRTVSLTCPPADDFTHVTNALGWQDAIRELLSESADSLHNDGL